MDFFFCKLLQKFPSGCLSFALFPFSQQNTEITSRRYEVSLERASQPWYKQSVKSKDLTKSSMKYNSVAGESKYFSRDVFTHLLDFFLLRKRIYICFAFLRCRRILHDILAKITIPVTYQLEGSNTRNENAHSFILDTFFLSHCTIMRPMNTACMMHKLT